MDVIFHSPGESPERRRLLELMLRRRGIGVKTSRIPLRGEDSLCAVSHAQQRLWFIDQLGHEGGAAYHIHGAVRLLGTLDRAALRGALDAIVGRHEVLRTRFTVIDGNPMQVISAWASFALLEQDLSELNAPEREAEVDRLALEELRTRFDLAVGPLIRGRLLRIAGQEHMLLLTLHHIISDGWSMGILIRELSALYAAFREGKADPLPPLPIQYADYAVWQRQWLQEEALEHQLSFWCEHLRGAPVLHELPSDRPRPVAPSYRGGRVSLSLSEDLTGRLTELAKVRDTTLFVVLQTAFVILLSGLSNQKDIVIGVPVANRQRTEVEPLIGFFVNTLALRVKVSDEASLSSLLEHVKAVTLAGHDNQDVPFERVVEALNPPRTLSHSPVFQALLVLQNTPRGALSLPGLDLMPVSLWDCTEKFDLTVSLHETQGGIGGSFGYATDLFDGSTIERWVAGFESVLMALVQDLSRRVGAVSLLSEHSRREIIAEFNATRVDHPPPVLVHELFERQAQRTPEDVAVIHEGHELTYVQLNRRANRLAHHLRSLGVGPDRTVAICLERGMSMAVAVLAVLKAGGAYVPLDPTYPPARLDFMLKDAAPGVVLAERATMAALGECASPVILMDDEPRQVEQQNVSDPTASEVGLAPEHLGYVIYTSGSTGQPKAVGLPHRALANLMHWHLTTLPAAARVLQFASLSFDASFHELFAAWGCGGALVIPAQEIRYDPAALVRFMDAHDIDKAIFPVTLLQQIAELQQEAADHLSQLRHVMATGEQLKITPAVRRLFELLPRCVLHNHYGPSETHVVTALTLAEPPCSWPDQPSIGKPIANTQIYILDSNRKPVPIGVVGELFIGGAGVARGYLNRPELTAERFVADPYDEDATARMYRTGDLARWRADGNIEYLGRNDQQVKIRGFRIELGEIEGCLSRHERIREAVVLARQESSGEKRLIAYCTAQAGTTFSSEELRGHLRASLPEYMVPSVYVRVDNIPLTPNGKVDREALQRLGIVDSATTTHAAPVGEFEQALAAIWQELLQVERVSRHDNFFDLGGHSMLTARLISRLRQLGLLVSLATVFKNPTLESLARCLEMGLDQDLVPNPILLRAGEGIPLFFVHEVSGDVLPYLPLARLLTPSVPVWGLQSLGIWHLESLEQIAADQIEAMRRVQPRGPYRLAGWSLGAVIAYEMADQLIGADETVEFLGMIDAIAPIGTSSRPMDDQEVLGKFIKERWLATLGPAVVQELSELQDIAQFLDICQARKYLPDYFTVSDIRRLIKNRRLIPEMTRRYSPASLPMRVHFFDASEPLQFPFSRNWEALIGNRVSRQVIGGTHRTITQPPQLQRLAAAMSEALASAASDEQVATDYSPVCPIQLSEHARGTIFCVPGAGAGVTCFLALGQALGGGINMYGLQPRGLDGMGIPHSSVSAAAKFHLEALRKSSPSGPYRLLAHSFGGWVAIEMARQLREQREEVATIIVLDSEAPRGERRHFSRIGLLMQLISAIEMASERSLGLTAQDLEFLDNGAQLRLLRDRMVSNGALPRDATVESLQGILRVFSRNLNTVYLPSAPVDADVALFQAVQPADAGRDKQLTKDAADWRKLARSLSVFAIPGDHMTMLRAPHVNLIAQNIKTIWGLS